MIRIPFTKMTGAGNDFVVIDNRNMLIRGSVETFAQRVCDRKFGIGSDGLLLLEPSSKAEFLMRYVNADGSMGSMCGNGGRCIARFAHSLGIVPVEMTFEAVGFVYRATVQKDTVRLHMKDPTQVEALTLHLDTRDLDAYFLDTGSPNVVVFSEDLETPLELVDMDAIGHEIRWHERFQPEGTNVNIVQLLSDNSISNRTFERGVECETLACGTGSVAAAIVVALKKRLMAPITVQTQSGKSLRIDFNTTNRRFADVVLEGDARVTFVGELKYDEKQKALVS